MFVYADIVGYSELGMTWYDGISNVDSATIHLKLQHQRATERHPICLTGVVGPQTAKEPCLCFCLVDKGTKNSGATQGRCWISENKNLQA